PQGQDRVAELVDKVLQPLGVTRRRGYAITRFERDLDERATQTARTPRHEPHPGHGHSFLLNEWSTLRQTLDARRGEDFGRYLSGTTPEPNRSTSWSAIRIGPCRPSTWTFPFPP